MKIRIPFPWWRRGTGTRQQSKSGELVPWAGRSPAGPLDRSTVGSRRPTSRSWAQWLGWLWRRGRALWPWIVVFVCWAIPLVALIVAGSIWLYENGWLLAWFSGAFFVGLVGWVVAHWAVKKERRFPGPEVKPAPDWPPVGLAAWAEVERLAEAAEKNPPPLNDWQSWQRLVGEVLETVARHYFPDAEEPLLEVSLPRMARVVELVARDIRQVVCEHIPLADKLTVGDLRRAQRFQALISQLYQLYRLIALGFNPITGIPRILRDMAVQGIQQTTADGFVRWATGYLVRRTGYYAIMLYGGYMVLDEKALADFRTPQSARDQAAAVVQENLLAQEPLRVLVVGRRGAGKSSIISVLAGEPVAPLGVGNFRPTAYRAPTSGDGPPWLLIEAPDLETRPDKDPYERLRGDVSLADLIVVVVPADATDLQPERTFLQGLESDLARDPHRVPPALAVVATRADCVVADEPAGLRGRPDKGAKPADGKVTAVNKLCDRLAGELELSPQVPILVDSFQLPAAPEVTARLNSLIQQVLPKAQIAYVARVRRALQSFDLHRDVLRPFVNTARKLWRSLTSGKSSRAPEPPAQ
ncbi:MAG: hypothetical protein RMJ16_11655 [Thermoguttaceae bacterium]|nr:hypothetical protein [Thermoguttaceae bacterium]